MTNLTFNDLGLKETLVKAIDDLGFTTPSPIQAEAIPVALSGNAKILDLAKKNEETISTVVLSDAITEGTGDGKEWDINGEKVIIAVARV